MDSPVRIGEYELSFSCTQCGNCCSGPEEGVIRISEEEMDRLATHLQLTPEAFEEKYIEEVDGEPSIVEKSNKDCVFLHPTERSCTIYEFRPEQCKTWPYWPQNLESREEWEYVEQVCPGSSSKRVGMNPETRAAIFSELEEIYRDLQEELDGRKPVCEMSGRCCRFAAYDHRLYTSEVEMMYLLEHHPLPEALSAEDVCPYMKEGKCTVRDHRMLGCRIYYCDETFKGEMPDYYEVYHARIRELTEKYWIDWSYFDFMHRMRNLVPTEGMEL